MAGNGAVDKHSKIIFAHVITSGKFPKHSVFVTESCNTAGDEVANFNWSTNIFEVFKAGKDHGIQETFLSAFSLSHSDTELDGRWRLFNEIATLFHENMRQMLELGVQVNVVGDIEISTTRQLQNLFSKTVFATKHCTEYKVKVFFGCGGLSPFERRMVKRPNTKSKHSIRNYYDVVGRSARLFDTIAKFVLICVLLSFMYGNCEIDHSRIV